MNFFAAISLLVISLIVGQSYAIKESCRTCRGSSCSQEDVLQLECNQFVPALPFESQLLTKNDVEDLKYGCLKLEYLINDTPDHIEQCILTTDVQSFCDTLGNSLNVKQCTVQSIDGSKTVRSISDNEVAADELQAVNSPQEQEEVNSEAKKTDTGAQKRDSEAQDTDPDAEETNPDPEETNPDPEETNPDPEETNPDPEETNPDPEETNPDAEETDPDAEETNPDAEETNPDPEETNPDPEETNPDAEETDPDAEETDPDAEETDPDAEETDPNADDTDPEAEETTVTTTASSVETTTSHASAIHLTSLFSFLGLLAMLML